jgi:hypothetical protein
MITRTRAALFAILTLPVLPAFLAGPAVAGGSDPQVVLDEIYGQWRHAQGFAPSC